MITYLKKVVTAIFLLTAAQTVSAQQQQPATWILKSDTSNSDYVTSVWTNPLGESYVIGHVNVFPNGSNIGIMSLMTVKVNTQGQELWRKVIVPNTNNQIFPKAITGDPSGNIYVLYNQSFQYTDSVVSRIGIRKYDPAGNTLWSRYLTNYADGLVESAAFREFAYDNGYLYTCGSTFNGVAAPLDGLLYKVDAANGNIIWRSVYNSTYNTDDSHMSFALAQNGDVYTIGRSRGYAGPGGVYSDYDMLVVRYDGAGNQLWDYRLNGSGNSNDFGLNVAVDAAGNAYASGQTDVLALNSDSVVIEKLSPAGQRLWRYGFIGSNTGNNYKQPVLVQPNGNVAGTATTASGIRTFALNPANGAVIWTAMYNRDNQGPGDHPMEMIQDQDGNLYIAGNTRVSGPVLSDVTTLKYTAGGSLEWYAYYTEPHTGSQESGVSLALDATGNVYTIGWVQNAQYNNDFFLAKYGNNPVMATAESSPEPFIAEVYPNPATDVLFVKMDNRQRINLLELVNSLGQVVWQTFDSAAELKIPVARFQPGMYLLRATNSNGASKGQKVVLHR